ncbi:MAG: c-type cytochrome domain-containing protein [Rubripirellula sp.]
MLTDSVASDPVLVPVGTYTVEMRYHRGSFVNEARFFSLSGLDVMRSLIPQLSKFVVFLSVTSIFFTTLANAAGLTAEEKKTVQTVNASVLRAAKSYTAGDFKASAEYVRTAVKQIEEATKGGSQRLYDDLLPAMQRIEKARTLLDFEGITLPTFTRPKRPEDAPAKPKPGTTPEPGNPEPMPADGISFTKAVAPILSTRCGRCHASDSKGGFNLATYAALMKGPPEGVVIFAGDTVGSRLIETIETGDMPRGGGKVTPAELKILKDWIVAGAKFDGTDPAAPIAAGATTAEPPRPRLKAMKATGKETVSFAGDVAPLLVESCKGCHINAMRASGGLSMDTFAQLLRGGDSGDIVIPGNGEESLLVKKLRGTMGLKMPAGGRPAFSEDSIKLISTWIDEGATLDGASDNQPLQVMSQLAWAAAATPQELSDRRAEIAGENIKLVVSTGADLTTETTEHFYVVGSAAPATVKLVAELAEDQMKAVKSVVSADAGQAFFKGRATIFVMPKRYDYSEFAKMVEGRGIPNGWSSHWKYDGIDGYVSLVATDRDEKDEIEARLTSPLVALAVATRGGDVPRWLAEGTGKVIAQRHGNTEKSSRGRGVKTTVNRELVEALAAMGNSKQFLDGKLTPEQSDLIATDIMAAMLDRAQKKGFDGLLRNMSRGLPFEKAFIQSFEATPAQFVDAWKRWRTGK